MKQNQLFLFPEAYFGSMEHFEEEFLEDPELMLIHPCTMFEQMPSSRHNIGFFIRWMDHFSLEFCEEID